MAGGVRGGCGVGGDRSGRVGGDCGVGGALFEVIYINFHVHLSEQFLFILLHLGSKGSQCGGFGLSLALGKVLLGVKHPLVGGQSEVLTADYECKVAKLCLVCAFNTRMGSWNMIFHKLLEGK